MAEPSPLHGAEQAGCRSGQEGDISVWQSLHPSMNMELKLEHDDSYIPSAADPSPAHIFTPAASALLMSGMTGWSNMATRGLRAPMPRRTDSPSAEGLRRITELMTDSTPARVMGWLTRLFNNCKAQGGRGQ